MVRVIFFWRFVLRNDIDAGEISWRREGVLNQARNFVRFYAIIMGVTLNCQLSKLFNTFLFST